MQFYRLTVECVPVSNKLALRKHAYSNILKISSPETESFQIKMLIVFMLLLKT